MVNGSKVKWGIVFLVFIVLTYTYKTFNPIDYHYFPKCPFRELTGYKCPGCGSQRAIHYLLNLDIRNALRENFLLVVSIPYLLIGFLFEISEIKNEKLLTWRKRLYGTKAIKTILVLIISFWILRNITFCQDCI